MVEHLGATTYGFGGVIDLPFVTAFPNADIRLLEAAYAQMIPLEPEMIIVRAGHIDGGRLTCRDALYTLPTLRLLEAYPDVPTLTVTSGPYQTWGDVLRDGVENWELPSEIYTRGRRDKTLCLTYSGSREAEEVWAWILRGLPGQARIVSDRPGLPIPTELIRASQEGIVVPYWEGWLSDRFGLLARHGCMPRAHRAGGWLNYPIEANCLEQANHITQPDFTELDQWVNQNGRGKCASL